MIMETHSTRCQPERKLLIDLFRGLPIRNWKERTLPFRELILMKKQSPGIFWSSTGPLYSILFDSLIGNPLIDRSNLSNLFKNLLNRVILKIRSSHPSGNVRDNFVIWLCLTQGLNRFPYHLNPSVCSCEGSIFLCKTNSGKNHMAESGCLGHEDILHH